jgi:hypothetical protein
LRRVGATAARFVVERPADRDVLRLEVVSDPGGDTEQMVAKAAEQTRDSLRIRPEVSIVDSIDGDIVLVDAREW